MLQRNFHSPPLTYAFLQRDNCKTILRIVERNTLLKLTSVVAIWMLFKSTIIKPWKRNPEINAKLPKSKWSRTTHDPEPLQQLYKSSVGQKSPVIRLLRTRPRTIGKSRSARIARRVPNTACQTTREFSTFEQHVAVRAGGGDMGVVFGYLWRASD